MPVLKSIKPEVYLPIHTRANERTTFDSLSWNKPHASKSEQADVCVCARIIYWIDVYLKKCKIPVRNTKIKKNENLIN